MAASLHRLLRRPGRAAIEHALAHAPTRRLLLDALARRWVRKLPAWMGDPVFLHVAEYTRRHPEFFAQLERQCGTRSNEEFQSAFWGSDFAYFFLEQTENAFWQKDAYRLGRDIANEFGAVSYLDVACGYGAFSRWLKETHPDATVCATDIAESVLLEAARRAVAQRLDIAFARVSATRLLDRFAPRSFDVVVCLEALNYVADGLEAMRQMVAVARRCVFIMTPIGSIAHAEYRRMEAPVAGHDYDRFWIHPLLAYARALGVTPYRSGPTGARCFFIELRREANAA